MRELIMKTFTRLLASFGQHKSIFRDILPFKIGIITVFCLANWMTHVLASVQFSGSPGKKEGENTEKACQSKKEAE